MNVVFVNPERCVGCHQCEVACAVEHSQNKNLYQAVFETPKPRPRILALPGIYLNFSFPSKCRHCDPAPCMAICPTSAITRASDLNEIVIINEDKCMNCGMCAMVCPFDVITYHRSPFAKLDKLVAIKCDNCIDRQRRGSVPACVEVCKAGALLFGDVNELTKKARTRLARSVSVAMGEIRPEEIQPPESIAAWQGYGEALGKINEWKLGGKS